MRWGYVRKEYDVRRGCQVEIELVAVQGCHTLVVSTAKDVALGLKSWTNLLVTKEQSCGISVSGAAWADIPYMER